MNRLNILYNLHDSLLSRIVGISDTLLKEQLQEEYALMQVEIAQLEHRTWLNVLDEMHVAIFEYYSSQYTYTDNLFDLLEDCIVEKIKMSRCRVPRIVDQRAFLHLANGINAELKILDIENKLIFSVGYGTCISIHVNENQSAQLYAKFKFKKNNI
jgi:hypothetical protein